MKSEALDCGCFYEVDGEADTGKLHPCGELHRDLAARMRKPESRWVVLPVEAK